MTAVLAEEGGPTAPEGVDARELVSRTVRLHVTLTDAAQFFGVNYWLLRKAVTRGELPARKLGPAPTSPHFVRLADVGHYLAYSKGGGRRRGPRAYPPTVDPQEVVTGSGLAALAAARRPGAPPSPGRIAAARSRPRDASGRYLPGPWASAGREAAG